MKRGEILGQDSQALGTELICEFLNMKQVWHIIIAAFQDVAPYNLV
jgi:hypothetical protein